MRLTLVPPACVDAPAHAAIKALRSNKVRRGEGEDEETKMKMKMGMR